MRKSCAPSRRLAATSPIGQAAPAVEAGATSIAKSAVERKRPVAFRSPSSGGVATAEKKARSQAAASSDSGGVLDGVAVWKVFWCACSRKKHKSYDDGVLVVKTGSLHLFDMCGVEVGRTTSFNKTTIGKLGVGDKIEFSGKEIEAAEQLASTGLQAEQVFSAAATAAAAAESAVACLPTATGRAKSDFKAHGRQVTVDPEQQAALQQIREQQLLSKLNTANPDAPDALVLFRCPTSGASVVVEPFLARVLRPHQREGVGFLFNCVTGRHGVEGGAGCILADSMGLGKTLQALTLLWTLMKQGPEGAPLVRRAVVVAPTSLLGNWHKECRHWLTSKRLDPYVLSSKNTGRGASYPAKQLIADWGQDTRNLQRCLLITSYEQFRQHAKAINAVRYDLLICDEGHRLKNPSAQISRCLMAAPTPRRVILSGTPVQNDLEEFFTMVDFVSPDALGSAAYFRSFYQAPIVRSREPGCSPDEHKLGRQRSKLLAQATSAFILKRSADILARYLPPKTEQVVFCRPSALQTWLYQRHLHASQLASCYADPACALQTIIHLRKLANHPAQVFKAGDQLSNSDNDNNDDDDERPASDESDWLLSDSDDDSDNDDDNDNDATESAIGDLRTVEDCPRDDLQAFEERPLSPHFSGKLAVLEQMLAALHPQRQRVVVASLFGRTLDVIQALCKERGYAALRLDGSVVAAKRQRLVDRFNDPHSDVFVLLLASKAGGVGLNLIGGSRLVLFDGDWNPTTDQQAMARIWRDGQKEACWVYRLLTAGTIDEKIFQRQLAKQALASTVVDDNRSVARRFSKEDLRDIFSFNAATLSDTHDLLRCACHQSVAASSSCSSSSSSSSSDQKKSPTEAVRDILSSMAHLTTPDDPVLRRIAEQQPSMITMVFQSQTAPAEK